MALIELGKPFGRHSSLEKKTLNSQLLGYHDAKMALRAETIDTFINQLRNTTSQSHTQDKDYLKGVRLALVDEIHSLTRKAMVYFITLRFDTAETLIYSRNELHRRLHTLAP